MLDKFTCWDYKYNWFYQICGVLFCNRKHPLVAVQNKEWVNTLQGSSHPKHMELSEEGHDTNCSGNKI